MYCRTKAYDDEIKRQQTRKNQGRRTVFTHDYIKRRGPNFGSQITQNFNQQPRYGNQNNQTPYRQTGFNSDRNRTPNSDGQNQQDRSSNFWTNGPNNWQQTQYIFNGRPENSDTQYNENFRQNDNLPTPNSVEFIDDHDTNMISDLSFCNQIRQKTSHSFQFEESYDSLCYKFYLQDIEEQNLRLKTERIEPPVEDYTDDTESLVKTQGPINCSEYEYPITSSVSSTPILNVKSHSETEESLEESSDEEKTNTTHAKGKNFSDSQTDESMTLNSSHTETMNKHFVEEPVDHPHFELIIEPSNSTKETNSGGNAFAEEHLNDP